MNAVSLVEEVKRAGGVLTLDGNGIRFVLPQHVEHLIRELCEKKPEVMAILRSRGGRVATFPHCPKCASFALHRPNNEGVYECHTCGLREITEDKARQVE